MKTHWKKLTNPDFLGAYALNPDEDMIVTIKSVSEESFVGNGGKKEEGGDGEATGSVYYLNFIFPIDIPEP